MAKVSAHIWHDSASGQIIAVGHSPSGAKHKSVPVAGNNQAVIEAHVDESKLKTLHATHKVDVQGKALVAATANKK
jgi:hypothetical protein